MNFNNVRAFASVVEAGSMAEASRRLGVPKSTISRGIGELEVATGARLLERSSRSLRLTPAGERLYDHCQRMLLGWDAAVADVRSLTTSGGLIRVTAPSVLAHTFLPELFAEFLQDKPQVALRVDFSERRLNLVEEGYDLAIRGGPLQDSSLVARYLAVTCDKTYASPQYVEAFGPLAHPAELAGKGVLHWAPATAGHVLTLQNGVECVEVPIQPLLITCDVNLMLAGLRAGLGPGMLPEFIGREEVQAGRLVSVLAGYKSKDIELHAVFPSHKSITPTLRELADLLAVKFSAL